MKITIPSIRVEEKTKDKMEASVKKFNKENIVKISFQEFRRLSYEFLSKFILQDKENQIKDILHLE